MVDVNYLDSTIVHYFDASDATSLSANVKGGAQLLRPIDLYLGCLEAGLWLPKSLTAAAHYLDRFRFGVFIDELTPCDFSC